MTQQHEQATQDQDLIRWGDPVMNGRYRFHRFSPVVLCVNTGLVWMRYPITLFGGGIETPIGDYEDIECVINLFNNEQRSMGLPADWRLPTVEELQGFTPDLDAPIEEQCVSEYLAEDHAEEHVEAWCWASFKESWGEGYRLVDFFNPSAKPIERYGKSRIYLRLVCGPIAV